MKSSELRKLIENLRIFDDVITGYNGNGSIWIFLGWWIYSQNWLCKKNFWISFIWRGSGISRLRPTFKFSNSKKTIKNRENQSSKGHFLSNRPFWIRWNYQFFAVVYLRKSSKLILQITNNLLYDIPIIIHGSTKNINRCSHFDWIRILFRTDKITKEVPFKVFVFSNLITFNIIQPSTKIYYSAW